MKVLIIRFSSIGDIVMMSSAVRVLHEQKNAEITFATKSVFVPLVAHNPHIKQVVGLESDGWQQFVQRLKQEQFDYIIDLHNNLRSKRLSSQLQAKCFRINKLSLQKSLYIKTKWNSLPDKHVAHRAIETAKSLGVQDDQKGMEFFFPEDFNMDLPYPTDAYIALAVGTTHFTKNMPEHLLETIIQAASLPIVLLGGKQEMNLAAALETKFPQKLINRVGQASLLESAYLVSQAKYLVAGDTGLLHIACALKKPSLSIWGATIPEFGVFPYYGDQDIPHHIAEVKLSCRPCSKHGTASCPKQHFNCMEQQNTTEIRNFMQVLSVSR